MNARARIRRTAVVGVTLAAALVAAAAPPASAERLGLDDPADVGGASLSDILAVSAIHGPKRVITKVDFAELKRESDGGPSSVAIFIDTDRTKKGPEFRIATGLQAGTDYQLVRMVTWKAVGQPLSCRHAVEVDFAANQVRARVNRRCLGNPATVRIGVKMTDLFDGSHPIVDWLGRPRFLSIPIARA